MNDTLLFPIHPVACIVAVFGAALACGGIAAGPISQPSSDGGSDATPTADAAPPLPDGSRGGTCGADSDCPSGQECAWSTESDSCSASGTCVVVVHEPCGAETLATACGCDGTSFSWSTGCSGLPAGWGPQPSLHSGACAGDGGPSACATTAECGTGYECLFEISQACSARGQCVSTSKIPQCNCAAEPACGCDGTSTFVSCCSNGYASVPVAHEGPCDTDGGL